MNMEQPLEQSPVRGVEAAVAEHELKKRQRLEMLREGHDVVYNGLRLKYDGEEARESFVVKLKTPDGMITSVPAELLAEEGWELAPSEE